MASAAAAIAPSVAKSDGRQSHRHLALNENPFGPSPRVLDVIKMHLDGLCRYPRDAADALTEVIAAREQVSPKQIVLGEILDVLGLYLAAEGGRGSEFLYSTPGYTALVDAVAPAGGKAIGVPLDHRLQNDLPGIAARVTDRTRAIYLVNPHNPSGTVSDTATFLEFVREQSRRRLVIVDEAYLEFDPDFETRSAVNLVRGGTKVIVFRTFSKIYGLANLAIGYAIASEDLAERLHRTGIGMFYSLNGLALIAAKASLEDKDYVPAVRAKVAAERDAWHAFLQKLKRPYAESHGSFIFFDSGRPHQTVAAALAAKGIEIGRAFPPYDNWLRISIGLPDDNEAARKALVDVLR